MREHNIFTLNAKMTKLYERNCAPICRKYDISQKGLDIILFLANNPVFNTATDICETRMIKSGIVSVTVENLIRSGFLVRENDKEDRRKQRLLLSEKAASVAADGRAEQRRFGEIFFSNFTDEEKKQFETLSQKIFATMDELIKEV